MKSTPVLVLECMLCRRVRDEEASEHGQGQWCDVMAYLAHHRLGPGDVVFSDTYCPECDLYYEQLITYGQNNPHIERWISHGPSTT